MAKQENTQELLSRIEDVLRHIRNVQNSAELLGKRLILEGHWKLGKSLIANSFLHDNSKFHGIEWDCLCSADEVEPSRLMEAIAHHQQVNPHHPEYWEDGVNSMPEVYIAEMVCDWHARSTEAGTDLRQWVKETACDKYGISLNGGAYKKIKRFIDLLLNKPLKAMKT